MGRNDTGHPLLGKHREEKGTPGLRDKCGHTTVTAARRSCSKCWLTYKSCRTVRWYSEAVFPCPAPHKAAWGKTRSISSLLHQHRVSLFFPICSGTSDIIAPHPSSDGVTQFIAFSLLVVFGLIWLIWRELSHRAQGSRATCSKEGVLACSFSRDKT